MTRKSQRIIGLLILLMLTSSKFLNLPGNETIRPIQYIYLLTIGLLLGILLYEFIVFVKGKMSK